MGRKKVFKPTAINLLQQTPADTYLGDMLLETPGIVRLFEFKNKKSSLTKEKDKLERLKKALKEDKEMIDLSKLIHWYIETEPEDTVCKNRIVPYLNAFDNAVYGLKTIEEFIEKIVDEIINHSIELDSEAIKAYLDLLRYSKGGNKGFSTGGLIINVTKDGIRYVQISDFSQLRLQHKEYVKEIELMNQSIMKIENETYKYLEKEIRTYGSYEKHI